jgi:hypothetical protein
MLPLVPLKRLAEEDSDDSEVWEQVTDASVQESAVAPSGILDPPQIIITKGKKKSGITKEKKISRLRLHQVHMVSLLAAAIARNKWCNDGKLWILNVRNHSKYLLFDDCKANC